MPDEPLYQKLVKEMRDRNEESMAALERLLVLAEAPDPLCESLLQV